MGLQPKIKVSWLFLGPSEITGHPPKKVSPLIFLVVSLVFNDSHFAGPSPCWGSTRELTLKALHEESRSYPLPATIVRRASPTPHLGRVGELVLTAHKLTNSATTPVPDPELWAGLLQHLPYPWTAGGRRSQSCRTKAAGSLWHGATAGYLRDIPERIRYCYCSRSQEPQNSLTHWNEHSQVKLFGQKGRLCDPPRHTTASTVRFFFF